MCNPRKFNPVFPFLLGTSSSFNPHKALDFTRCTEGWRFYSASKHFQLNRMSPTMAFENLQYDVKLKMLLIGDSCKPYLDPTKLENFAN